MNPVVYMIYFSEEILLSDNLLFLARSINVEANTSSDESLQVSQGISNANVKYVIVDIYLTKTHGLSSCAKFY